MTTATFGGTLAACLVNSAQVCAGLLILSVIAAASLAEERASGSLDLLLTTMISTPQIVLGKWLGTYRAVPFFAVLPVVISFGLAHDRSETWTDAVVLILYIFCSGAAIASLGLAMATWLPRVGSAVAATVSIYLAITVGLSFTLLWAPPHNGLVMASPFTWAFLVTWKTTDSTFPFHFVAPRAIIWLVIMAIVAVALLIATLATFDRKLGRGESDSSRRMNGIFTRSVRAFRFVFLLIAALATVDTMSDGPTPRPGTVDQLALVVFACVHYAGDSPVPAKRFTCENIFAERLFVQSSRGGGI